MDDEGGVALNLDAAPHRLELPGWDRVAAHNRLGDVEVRSTGSALAVTLPPWSGVSIG
jgi:hypothetical protein